MSKTVQEVMTRSPRCIATNATLREAHRLMRDAGVRHLPVLEAGRLAGVVSERDLLRIGGQPGIDGERDPVSLAMSSPAFWVVPETPVAVVAAQMRSRGFGAVVVVEAGDVIGIFTRSDALKALAAPLHTDPHSPPRRP